MNTFIIKNPPNLNPAAQGSSLTEGKRSKRKKGENGTTESANNSVIMPSEVDTSIISAVEVDIEVPSVVADVSFSLHKKWVPPTLCDIKI